MRWRTYERHLDEEAREGLGLAAEADQLVGAGESAGGEDLECDDGAVPGVDGAEYGAARAGADRREFTERPERAVAGRGVGALGLVGGDGGRAVVGNRIRRVGSHRGELG